MIWIAALLSAASGLQEQDAEKLHEQFKSKISGASSIKAVFKTRQLTPGGDVVGEYAGTLQIQEPNQLHLALDGKSQGKSSTVSFTCDGTKVRTSAGKVIDAPKYYARGHRWFFFNGGMAGNIHVGILRPIELKPCDFKAVRKEKVGETETQVLEYRFDTGKPELEVHTTLWLDAKTSLPVKRTLRLKRGEDEALFDETYESIKLDEKIDPKTFELPK